MAASFFSSIKASRIRRHRLFEEQGLKLLQLLGDLHAGHAIGISKKILLRCQQAPKAFTPFNEEATRVICKDGLYEITLPRDTAYAIVQVQTSGGKFGFIEQFPITTAPTNTFPRGRVYGYGNQTAR